MYDPMDHLEETWTRNRSGRSALRSRLSKSETRRKLILFAKYFMVQFLNSSKSVEEIVDEYSGGEPPAFVRDDG